MSQYINGIVPADLDPDAISLTVVGEFIIDRAAVDSDGKLAPTGYVALTNPDTGKKQLYLLSGAGKYDLIEHLARAHVIGANQPTNFDRSTLWFNTQLVYVEPADVTKSYITIRTETSPGQWEWRKILPYTTMDALIIGRDDSGNAVTLASLIKNNRVINKLPINVRESGYGELYVNDQNELYFNQGPNPEDQHLVGTLSSYLRDRIIEQITVSQTQPLNFNFNSVWITDDADITLARSKYINLVDPSKSTGLKFTRDSENKMKTGAQLENENKSILIDNNSAPDYGHVWLNMPFNEEGKYYLELFIDDKFNSAQLLLLADGIKQPSLNNYGSQPDGSVVMIDHEKNITRANTTQVAFPFHRKTVFFEVDKTASTTNVSLGYVTDSGEKRYIYGGDSSVAAFSLNLARIAVASYSSRESNAYTRFSILPFLIKKIPNGFKGINNTLPGENPFTAFALGTNAKSVHLAPGVKLADQVESGRIIPVFRDYGDRTNARVNEVIVKNDTSQLFIKRQDGAVVPIVGQFDDIVMDHIRNSLKVTPDDVSTFTKLNDDPRRIYVSTKPSLPTSPNHIIEGNMAVIDNSASGDDTTYKMILPKTKTTLVNHDYLDNNNSPVNGDLKTYLDSLDAMIKAAISKDNVYSGYEELLFKKTDLTSAYNTQQAFVQELTKRMLVNSLYIESITKKPVGGTSSNQIDNFFDVPEDGIMYAYADRGKNLHATLMTRNGVYTRSFFKPMYNPTTNWKRHILELNEVATMNNITASGDVIVDNKVEGKVEVVTPTFKLDGLTGQLVANSNNITNNIANLIKYNGSSLLDTLKYTIGDNKFKSAEIISKDRPVWINETGETRAWLTTADIRNGWNYKGKTFNNGQHTDLNDLNLATNNGYYTIPTNTTAGNNYPKINITGLVHNYKIDNEVGLQLLVSKEADGHRIYIRSESGSGYTPWNSLVNDVDLATKLNTSGGTITGNLTVSGSTTMASVKATQLNTPRVFSDNTNLINFALIGNRSTITMGDANTGDVVLANSGTKNPQYYNGTKYQNIVIEDDLNNLKLSLRNDYYTKIETNGLLAQKVDLSVYTPAMANKVSKSGDEMTGTLNMSSGDITVGNGSINISSTSKLSLPGKLYTSNTEFTSENNNVYTNSTRYDVIRISTNNEQSVFSVSAGKPITESNTNTPTTIQLFVDKNNNLSVGTVINKATKTTPRAVLMADQIVDAYTGGTAKVLSAERGKELDSNSIGSPRGDLHAKIGVSGTYNISNLTSLPAGYYTVTTKNEIKGLGLDENVIKNNNGILFVEGNLTNQITSTREYRYITRTEQPEQFVMAIRTVSNNLGEWKYIYDISAYYTRAEIDALLKALEDKITSQFKSSKFRFTGNSTNNSIPKKLVHTHNHESLGDSDTLYFKTNITASSPMESKNFVIHLEGFSTGGVTDSSSTPFNILLSGKLSYNTTPTLERASVVSVIPGSSVVVENFKLTSDGFVTFSVKDNVTNKELSFDTYMRFSSISDTNFQGEISSYGIIPIN